jgi:prolyl 4-hydroxylase
MFISFNRKLHSWKSEYETEQNNIEKYVTHPINAFLMIKRLSVDIDELYAGKIYDAIFKFNDKVKHLLPTLEDLDGAVDGLLRLQTLFKIPSEDIANVKISDFDNIKIIET